LNMENREIQIKTGDDYINGNLNVPDNARGIIIFAHGSGSSRFSPRNNFVAQELQNARFATLLIDLLTVDEEAKDMVTAEYRFDIELLSQRLLDATNYVDLNSATSSLPVGYFGSSTGAAAALEAAATLNNIRAIVSRGGRPDMAENLTRLTAPTLLIVGEYDEEVLKLNYQALQKMKNALQKNIQIVPRANHLFEEPGALEKVLRLSRDWFIKYL
jgi:putative phosphoribosyl transferase